MEGAGFDYQPPTTYVKVDPERATRIAHEQEVMQDALAPGADLAYREQTLAAYDALARETVAQYQAIVEHAGVQFDFMPDGRTQRRAGPHARATHRSTSSGLP